MDTETSTLECVGVMMDGNRRWGKQRGVAAAAAHREGAKRLKELIGWTKEAHIPHLAVYAFSTENWNRTPEEVADLMNLFRFELSQLRFIDENHTESHALRFIGERDRLPSDVRRTMEEIEAQNPTYPAMTVWIAISYGGRAEIVAAVNEAVRNGKAIDEAAFSKLLWSADMPDPDIVIRTGGDHRLSNFLPWQSVYSEFFFTETLWPDFSRREFQGILEAYGTRVRRKGT